YCERLREGQVFAEAYRAGPVTKSRAGTERRISRLELHRWTLLVLAIAYWANILRAAPPVGEATGVAFAIDAVLAHGAFCAAAWMVIAALVARQAADVPVSRREILAAVTIALLGILPARQATVVALLALGSQFAIAPNGRASRPIAAILGCLALEMIW